MKLPYQSTKNYSNLPCAHRQHLHAGKCAHVHGYSRSFYFLFGATALDDCGFVVDFGGLKPLSRWLELHFDHTLLLNAADPLLSTFHDLEARGACRVVVPLYGVGMEQSARWAGEQSQAILDSEPATKGRCFTIACECRENDKNSGIYFMPGHEPVGGYARRAGDTASIEDYERVLSRSPV